MAKKHNPGSKKPGVKRKRRAQPQQPASAEAEMIEGKAEEVGKKSSVSPFEFFQQVRNEGEKVTWTTRNETTVSTIMVLIMVAIMSLFFFLVDQTLRFVVGALLSLGGS